MAAVFKALCDNDTLWDTDQLINNSWPELTQCFQWTVLAWAPCVWLWACLPVHLWYIRYKNNSDLYRIPSNQLNITKIFICLLLVFLSILQIFIASQKLEKTLPPKNALYFTCAVQAITYVCYKLFASHGDPPTCHLGIIKVLAACLNRISRKAGIASPCILFIFWLISLLTHTPPLWSYVFLKVYETEKTEFYILCFCFGCIAVEFLLSFVAERLLPNVSSQNNLGQSPETFASFPSKLTFHWMTGYIWRSYRKCVGPEEVWDLPEHFKSAVVVPRFKNVWDAELEVVKKKKKLRQQQETHHNGYSNDHHHKYCDETIPLLSSSMSTKPEKKTWRQHTPSLLKCLCKAFLPELLRSHVMRLMADSILFLLPALTSTLISYVQDKDHESSWHGYALIAAFFTVTFTYSLLFNQNSYRGDYIGMKVKTVVLSAVYKKALTMNNETRRLYTTGKIVNLMAIDCQVLQNVTSNLYIMLSAPFQICVAFYFLNAILGVSFVAGVVVIVALVPLNARISVLAKRAQSEQLRVKDERLKTMNEILSGIKVLKLHAWESSFEHRILMLRRREVKLLRTAAVLNVINVFSWLCSPVLVTTTTFITYIFVSSEQYLDSKTAFVSLILFNILSLPMNKLPNIITDLVSAHVSIKRLGAFLSGEDLNPDEVTRDHYCYNPSTFEEKVRCLRIREKVSISISRASFIWDRSMPPVLKNISTIIPHGKLVAVVGVMGAGKSSLISAILGEMERIAGEIVVKGKLAYVPQQAWIQNMSLKQNILFDKKYQHSRYTQVIKACALQQDLELLVGGENAEIGEKGTTMSGGQRQRVSLARAVYYDADVYLLDDPLSAVDTHVGKHIFKHVISNSGMLRHKTRLLVTHGIHWLPMVDVILVMHQGSIIQSGSYEDLLAKDGPFAQYLKDHLLDDDEIDDPEIRYIRSEMSKKVDSVTSDGVTSADEDERPRRRRLKRKSRFNSPTQSKSEDSYTTDSEQSRHGFKLIQEEKAARGKVKGQVIVDFIRAFGVCFAVSLIALLMVYQGMGVGASIWLSKWTDDAYLKNISLTNTAEYREKTYTYLGVYSALGFIQSVCALVFVGNISLRMVVASKRLHDALLENILRQPMKFFDTTPLGRVINRFSRDVDTIDSQMARLVRVFFQQLFTVLSVLAVIIYTTPIFILAAVPIMLVYYFVQKLYIPSSRQLRRNESTTRSPIYSHFSETLTGTDSIRAYHAVDRFILESEKRVDKNNAFVYGFSTASRWIRIRLELLGNLIVLMDAWFAVFTDGLSGSLVGLSVSYALQMTSTLNELVQNSAQLESNVVSVERIVEYSRLPQEPAWSIPSKELDDDWPKKGDIEFHTYSTRYRSELDLVLKNVSCNIHDGEKIGIVGRTGAGKSSMSMALFRLIESAGGNIIIDGVNIADIGLHDLRSRLTIIPQDPVLFSGTLRFNIDPFGVHTDEEIWHTLDNAQLKGFVSQLKGGLSYTCEEGGQNLSVGQRQLICLARSLMRTTKVLMLDEATAAVDLEMDQLIQRTIRHCFQHCTILTVAHRLNTIMDYDRIIVLQSGCIAEFDTVKKLCENKDSIFYSMAKEANLLGLLDKLDKVGDRELTNGGRGEDDVNDDDDDDAAGGGGGGGGGGDVGATKVVQLVDDLMDVGLGCKEGAKDVVGGGDGGVAG